VSVVVPSKSHWPKAIKGVNAAAALPLRRNRDRLAARLWSFNIDVRGRFSHYLADEALQPAAGPIAPQSHRIETRQGYHAAYASRGAIVRHFGFASISFLCGCHVL
jgi:hypothetical protein